MLAVRITKKIIATLLAAQLSVVFGLCGGVCCLTAPNVAAAEALPPSHSHANHHQTPLPAAKSHCHSNVEKTEPAATTQVGMAQPAHHRHRGNTAGRTFALAGGQHCRCSVSSQESQPTSPAQTGSSAQKDKELALALPAAWQYADLLRPSPSASPPLTESYNPPFGGFQLSLRI